MAAAQHDPELLRKIGREPNKMIDMESLPAMLRIPKEKD